MISRKGGRGFTYLSGVRHAAVALDVDPDVLESVLGPSDRLAMQLLEPPPLHPEAHDGDPLRVRARDLSEARDGEEQVLERVERVVLGRDAPRGG